MCVWVASIVVKEKVEAAVDAAQGGNVSTASTALEALSCVGVNHVDDGGNGVGLPQQR